MGRTEASIWGMIMPLYRCYRMSEDDRITAGENLEAPTAPEAAEAATQLWAEIGARFTIEVWLGVRRVWPLAPSETAAD